MIGRVVEIDHRILHLRCGEHLIHGIFDIRRVELGEILQLGPPALS